MKGPDSGASRIKSKKVEEGETKWHARSLPRIWGSDWDVLRQCECNIDMCSCANMKSATKIWIWNTNKLHLKSCPETVTYFPFFISLPFLVFIPPLYKHSTTTTIVPKNVDSLNKSLKKIQNTIFIYTCYNILAN